MKPTTKSSKEGNERLRLWRTDMNETNRAFWQLETVEAERRMADPVIRAFALLDIVDQSARQVQIRDQKTNEQMLQHAEALRAVPALSEWAQSELSRRGGAAKKTDLLQRVILEAVQEDPAITVMGLLRHLENLQMPGGLISDIDEDTIYFAGSDGKPKEALKTALKHRLWRARKIIRSR